MGKSTPQKNLVIVGCGKAKVWDRADRLGKVRAKDAYVGSLFKSQRRFAEQRAAKWLILSAKYGLLHPEQPIANYNVTFGSRGAISAERVQKQWRQRLSDNPTIAVCLASKNYVRLLRDSIPKSVTLQTPLDGMGLFERMRWLKQHR